MRCKQNLIPSALIQSLNDYLMNIGMEGVWVKPALWMEDKKGYFTPLSCMQVKAGAYVACHIGFKDEVGPVRIVQGLNWMFA